jgi:pimeloyl-ACP methyl ester carboxylesterase
MQETSVALADGRVLHGLHWPAPGAPRVIALHGWLDNAASFVPLVPCLEPLDLVAIDLPGHGRSPHLPADAEYTPLASVAMVLDIADALGWERFGLLGHSMGAGIASLVAAVAPGRVDALVAIEALGALSAPAGETAARMRRAVEARRDRTRRPLRVFEDLAPAVRARMHANGLSATSARLLVERGVRAVDGGWQWSSDPRLMRESFTRMTEEQVLDVLAAIECPATVVLADPPQAWLPAAMRRARVAALRHGRLVEIAGGHHLHMDDPRAVAAAVTGAFAGAGLSRACVAPTAACAKPP